MTLRIGVAGVHGHGRTHLNTARTLGPDAVLAAIADPRGEPDPEVPVYPDAAEMIAAGGLDIVVLSTPIPTHVDLTARALRAGCHVLLEKPPVPTVADHRSLVRAAEQAGRAVQVGFQSLGSAGVAATIDTIASGVIGDVLHYGAVGLWTRSEQYWNRASWTGRRVLDGTTMADGVVTNPLAHAVATALAIAGAATPDDVSLVEPDLYRANDIEADDTSTVRISLASGHVLLAALTATAARRHEPYVLVRGTRGHLVYHYTLDLLHVFSDSPLPRTYGFSRRGLLEDLIAHATTGSELAVPLERTGAFTRVLEEVTGSAAPAPIASASISVEQRGDETFRVVDDVAPWTERAAWEARTFRELGAAWVAHPPE